MTTVIYPATSVEPAWRHQVIDTHDTQGRAIARQTKPTSASAGWVNEAWSYDANGNLSQTTDGRGNTTTFCYDVDYAGAVIPGGRRSLTRRIDPAPAAGQPRPVTLFQYDAADNLVQTVPPKGVASGPTVTCATDLSASAASPSRTDFAYDAATLTTLEAITRRATDPEAGLLTAVTRFEYGDAANPGLVTKVIPPRGTTGGSPDYTYATTFAYGASVADPLGNVTTYTYDAVGRRLTMVDPLGNAAGGVPGEHTWSYQYDQEDRLTRTEAPAPRYAAGETAPLVTQVAYDPVGNRTVVTDASGQVTKYAYDVRDSLALVCQSKAAWTDPAPVTTCPAGTIATAYSYDDLGNLKRVTRAAGDSPNERVVDYTYDGLGRLRKETQYPNWPQTFGTLITEATYDQASNRLTLKDPLLKTTTFAYDALNRLTGIDYTEAGSADVGYTYDAHGNRLSMADGTGTTSYGYDELDRLLSVTSPDPGGAKTVGYRYDRDGNRVKVIYPDSTAVTSTFDKASRLTGLLDWASRVTGYSYFPDGSLQATSHPNGTTSTQQYDATRRLRQVRHARPTGVTLGQYDYTLDALGNRTQLAEQVESLATSGTLAAWGANTTGKLGDGTTTQRLSPVAVSGLSGVTAASAGRDHSLALTADGRVWGWGSNSNGQLGLGTADSGTHATSALVPGLTEVTAVAGGGTHTLALRADGTLRAWGNNGNGRLGDGTTTQRTSPVAVSSLTNVVAIAAGTDHSLALRADGTVWGWGNNGNGRLGDGTTTQRTTPTQVVAGTGVCAGGTHLSGVIAIAAGGSHSLALKGDGTVCAWGNNGNGRLGDGTTTQRLTPVAVVGVGGTGTLGGVRALAAGDSHSLALLADGTLRAWGNNANGRLGTGSTSPSQSLTPVTVSLAGLPAGSRATALEAGYHHTFVRLADGTVAGWGLNSTGQLGLGDTTQRTAPTAVPGLDLRTLVTGGEDFTLALLTEATGWAWGANGRGQVGDGTTTNRTTPTQVSGLGGIVAVMSGVEHSLALTAAGAVWAWGANEAGQVGDGTTTDRTAPVTVGGLSGVASITRGWRHNLALKGDGTVAAWGANGSGQLGDGSTTNRPTPITVGGLTNVVAVAAGSGHSLAVTGSGTVLAWGRNQEGQLGDGTTTDRLTPAPVSGLTNVVAVAAGQHHSLAVTSTGAVWAWGSASFGQTGQGTVGFSSPTPVRVLAPSGSGFLDGIVAIRTGVAAGEVFSLALKADGTVYAWGGNQYGQLGDGTTTTRLRPVLVSGLTGASHLAAGLDFGVVRRADGTLRAWGRNDAGQLGASSSGDCGGVACSLTPLVVGGLTGAATAVAGGFGHSLTSTVAVGLTGGTTTYAYDRLSRLTGVTAPAGTTTSYGYDPVGNRLSRTRTGTTTVSYTYDRADRIKTVVQGSSTTYTMNANGNLTARGNDDFTYDQANRLKTAVVGGVSSSATYDGDGKRVSQTVAGVTTRSLYDVGGGLPVLLDDGTRKYVWGPGLAYAVSGSSVEVYHTDGLGSVRALTDGAGALIQTQATDEFGVPSQVLGTSGQPFGYTGEQRDSATGLVYLRARMYDPVIGRFVQRDAFAGMLASPLSLHRYSYVHNDPVNATDPSGHAASSILCLFPPLDPFGFIEFFQRCGPREQTRPAPKPTACVGPKISLGAITACPSIRPATSDPADDADRIGHGHAWDKHRKEFPWIKSQREFIEFIRRVIHTGVKKTLARGRTAYWDESTKTLVIHDPGNPDRGTVFRPSSGRAYFDDPKKLN